MTVATSVPKYGQTPTWSPSRPRLRPLRLLLAWVASAGALLVAAWIVPGAEVNHFGGALAAAARILDIAEFRDAVTLVRARIAG